MSRERQGPRGGVPENEVAYAAILEKLIYEHLLNGGNFVFTQAYRQAGDHDANSALLNMHINLRQLVIREDRLLDIKHAPFLRRAAQQVLRPLVNKVPPQVRKANKIRGVIKAFFYCF